MKRLFHVFLLTLTITSAALLATEPVPAPSVIPVIRFPSFPLPPQPPAPSPSNPTVLPTDVYYAFDADVPLIVKAYPPGLLGIVVEQGPLRIHGKFVDGSGVHSETRTYKGSTVVLVHAIGAGTATLVVTPVGVKHANDIQERMIDANKAPIPPPKPPDPPKPDPPNPQPNPAPIPEPGFRVLFVYESADLPKLPKEQLAVLYDTQTITPYLMSHCVNEADGKSKGFRRFDKDTDLSNESPIWQNALKRPKLSMPWLIISDGKTGYEGVLPANVAETMKLLKKYGGE